VSEDFFFFLLFDAHTNAPRCSIRRFMDDAVSAIVRDHADALCYKVSNFVRPSFPILLLDIFVRMQDSNEKHVHPRAFFAGGINPSGIPVSVVAFAPSTAPIQATRSHLTSVVLSVLQQSNVKAADAEGQVQYAPLNLSGRFY